jgi:uncharacterized protein
VDRTVKTAQPWLERGDEDGYRIVSLLADLFFEARIAATSLADYVGGSSLRLGVTGLSKSGKTVFLTALIQNLVQGNAARKDRLPVFRVHAEGRLAKAVLQPQPDDAVPRFAYEDHLSALTGTDRHWPDSTRRISELRITLEFESRVGWRGGPASLTIDIVDYPGEWLLDLPLLAKSFAEWSAETLAASALPGRIQLAADWHACLSSLPPLADANEDQARSCAALFTEYLRCCRDDPLALSSLPPGRFLMPGDMEGSPALTFSPLRLDASVPVRRGSLAAMMERRYEAYKSHVVKPFFRDHFARLDRQIVLVDALSALNSGPAAVRDLEVALGDVLAAFRAGRSHLLATIFRPRIDRILFAATKADHLHHTSHDRLEAILRLLTARAIARAEAVGATVDVIALAAVRATREARIKHGREVLDAIVGTPLAGEIIGGESFDGNTEAAIFPGELPNEPSLVFDGATLIAAPSDADYRFVRFRPPITKGNEPMPHIRLDRALEFLLGDTLR